MDLHLLIEKARPNIKKNSIDFYVRNMKILNDYKKIENLDFLNNPLEIKKKLEDLGKSEQTIRNFLSSAVVVLKAVYPDNEKKELTDKYCELMKKMQIRIIKKVEKNELTQKEADNFMTYDELKEIQKDYEKQVEEMDLNYKNKIISPKENKILLYYLVASLYTLCEPLRLDWANLNYTENKDDLKDITKNFLFSHGTFTKIVYLRHYKSVKKHGFKEFRLCKELAKIINLYRKFNTGSDPSVFLMNTIHFKLTPSTLGKIIPKTFVSKDGKKRANLNMVRKARVTDVVDIDKVKQYKDLSDKMLHSQNVQQSHYAKKIKIKV